jgi:hypothetical protein
VNWAPLSGLWCDNCRDAKSARPPRKRAFVQSTVLVAAIGMASGQQEVLFMIVNRWVKPFDAGRGPTRSMWMWMWYVLRRCQYVAVDFGLLTSYSAGRLSPRQEHHWRVPSIRTWRRRTDPCWSGDFVPECRGFGEGPCSLGRRGPCRQ